MKNCLLLIILSFTLQGCIGAFVVGAATGGAAAVNQDGIQSYAEDQNIRHQILSVVLHNAEFKGSHFEITCHNRNVLLLGETLQNSTRSKVEQIARNVPNVNRVYNQISLREIASTLEQTQDLWITTKVKSQMLATKDLDASQIKVVTEGRVVYLMGTIDKEQAEDAADIARKITNVLRVVKVFDYKTA